VGREMARRGVASGGCRSASIGGFKRSLARTERNDHGERKGGQGQVSSTDNIFEEGRERPMSGSKKKFPQRLGGTPCSAKTR